MAAPSAEAGAALTHLDGRGRAHMVDVGAKPETARGAIAEARVRLDARAFAAVRSASLAKGDAIAVARIAGIAAAKRAADLVPLCHPLRLSRVAVEAALEQAAPGGAGEVVFRARVEAVDRTGVEMEALTAALVAALTLYDMVKAVDRGASVAEGRVLEKWGGNSGHYCAPGWSPEAGEAAATR
jgi:cyclic pyranopterin phosphate synthase